MGNVVNEYALHTREFFINELDYLNGEIQEFVPTDNEDDTGVVAMDIKWKSGVHFILYQTLWCAYYYAVRNNEQISHLFYMAKRQKESSIYLQRLINDIDSGRYDKKLTPREEHLKNVQKKGLTGYMNNTKWRKIFDIVRDLEDEVGKTISIMYKCISENEVPIYYWSIKGDEYLHEDMYKYIEWLKIKPVVYDCVYRGRLLEPEYTYYDYKSLFLEKIDSTNLKYEYLEEEDAYIIYGYR